jgi:hypothetical protein
VEAAKKAKREALTRIPPRFSDYYGKEKIWTRARQTRMEKIEHLMMRIVIEGDGKDVDPEKIMNTLLSDENPLASADQRILMAMQEDWKEYKRRVPEARRDWDWKPLPSRGETTWAHIKKVARMSDQEMRTNQIVFRLRNSRRRQGMTNSLSTGDLTCLRYLEYEQRDLDILEMNLPKRKSYYLDSSRWKNSKTLCFVSTDSPDPRPRTQS